MISKEQIVSELTHIAHILTMAVPTKVEWGGTDEANDGKPGEIDARLAKVLESLPVTWEKDKAKFELSGTKHDDKGVGGIKTWVHASLPGKYKGEEFVFKMLRTLKYMKYKFTSPKKEKDSPTVSSLSKIKDTFDFYFSHESKNDENSTIINRINKANDGVYERSGELYKGIKDRMKDITDTPIKKFHKILAKHIIYLEFFVNKDDLKKDNPEMSVEELNGITDYVKEFFSEIGEENISVGTSFKKKENLGYNLAIAVKFLGKSNE
jgi:hypothetical protein